MVVGGGYSFVKNVAEVVEYYITNERRLQKSLVWRSGAIKNTLLGYKHKSKRVLLQSLVQCRLYQLPPLFVGLAWLGWCVWQGLPFSPIDVVIQLGRGLQCPFREKQNLVSKQAMKCKWWFMSLINPLGHYPIELCTYMHFPFRPFIHIIIISGSDRRGLELLQDSRTFPHPISKAYYLNVCTIWCRLVVLLLLLLLLPLFCNM